MLAAQTAEQSKSGSIWP